MAALAGVDAFAGFAAVETDPVAGLAIVGQWAQAERSHNGVILVSSTTIPPSDLAGLSQALERFAANFKPWPAFSHWLSPQG